MPIASSICFALTFPLKRKWTSKCLRGGSTGWAKPTGGWGHLGSPQPRSPCCGLRGAGKGLH